MKKPRRSSDSTTSYETAVGAAFDDLESVEADAVEAQERLSNANGRRIQLVELIRSLIAQLPKEHQAHYLEQLNSRPSRAPASVTRAGETVNNVIQLFAEQPRQLWTTAEVQSAFGARFGETDPKAVHNALATLERQGRLRRVSRGQYFDTQHGTGLVLPDDLQSDGPQKGGIMED
jgi:hypothetical protein